LSIALKKNRVELCFTPTYASWADPIEAHFEPLRQFTVANSNHRNHTAQTWTLHAYLRWRNTNARHPDVLAAQRKERARIRSEKGLRWGGRARATAAWRRTRSAPGSARSDLSRVLVQETEEHRQRVLSIGMPFNGISPAARHRPAAASAQPLGKRTTRRQGERLVNPVDSQRGGIADQDVLQVPQGPVPDPHGRTQPDLVQDILDITALVDRFRFSSIVN
jgi:hypothetical protein